MAKTLIHQAIEAERGPEQMRAFNTLSDSVQGDQESPESVAIDQATQGQQFTRILGSVGGAVAARLKNETGSRFNTQ
ncbi:MAG: hypothetical protein Q8P95_01860, partial [bacterium]|nr:hypothetical protein [bacterium]